VPTDHRRFGLSGNVLNVVKYALSRSLSPAMVAQYELALPNRKND
jgi:hypothetical protein